MDWLEVFVKEKRQSETTEEGIRHDCIHNEELNNTDKDISYLSEKTELVFRWSGFSLE